MTDQNTAPLDLDGLEGDIAEIIVSDCKPDIHGDLYGVERAAEAIASIVRQHVAKQAREAERMRGAATDLVSWFDKPMIGGRVWIIPAGDQGADDAVEAVRQALAPATGGGE